MPHLPTGVTRRRTIAAGGALTLCAAGLSTALTPAHAAGASTIEQIQGAAHVSPLRGQTVQDVAGRVIATNGTGFWMQSTTPDSSPSTSEGLFVYTRTAPAAHTGDDVRVDGTVSEFRPGGSTGLGNLSTTELTTPTVTVSSSGNPLPAPVVIGRDRIAPQQTIERGNPGSVELAGTPFDPRKNAIDFYESLEGMRVSVQDAQVVGPTAVSYGETPIVPGQHVGAVRSPRGGVVYSGYDHPNAMRVVLDTSLLPKGSVPPANVKDRYAGSTTGVLDYSFGNFHLLATSVGALRSAGLKREVTAKPTKAQAAVASFNVENLAPKDPATKYSRLAAQIVGNLRSPDLVALEEIQDNSGATDDGTTDSSVTVAKLVAAIATAGGPAYQARWIDPQDKTDGGQPGGNIRQVFIFRTDRGLSFVDKPGGTTTSSTTVTGKGPRTSLSASPGRIDPGNVAWTDSRKPLVGEFRWHATPLFVVANHFASKGGDDPLFGRWQQPVRSSETQRHQQASAVRGFVDSLLSANKTANVVVLGDLNDFEFSATADILAGHGGTRLTDLPRTLPKNERYTYDFEGNSQVLDHILIGGGLIRRGASYGYDIVHTNSEYADQDSDHDPQVVRLGP